MATSSESKALPSAFHALSLADAVPAAKSALGIRESAAAEVRRLRQTRTIVLNTGDVQSKRREILKYFRATWDLYEKLFEPLSYEAFYQRADPLRHPLIFYFGHTACLYMNKLHVAGLVDRINPEYESLFAVGVDEMSWDDMLENKSDWPTVENTKAFRQKVKLEVERVINTVPLTLPITWNSKMWVVLLGIEHERIHLETSAVLIRQLPLHMLSRHPFWTPCDLTGTPPENTLLPVTTETVEMTLGKPREYPLYGWDNEYGAKPFSVPAFSASKYLVTNREYLAFVLAGGYREERFWTAEGWKWANFRAKQPYPQFWINAAHREETAKRSSAGDSSMPAAVEGGLEGWRLRLMLEEVTMPWDWPVEVNCLEAKAFCAWKAEMTGRKLRLPTEDEYRVLRDKEVPQDEHQWTSAPGNINLEHHTSSTPVTLFAPSPSGFHDVIGNVWQHTETDIQPFSGFEVHPVYDDFSLPTFDAKHNLLMGGSWISTGNEATKHARYAFRRHFIQFAGIRYVESSRAIANPDEVSVYELDQAVNQYAAFHYDDTEYFSVPNFARHVAEIAMQVADRLDVPRNFALDLGCAVGRSTFHLARRFNKVVGLDFSTRFIRFATELQTRESVQYLLPVEGDVNETRNISLESLGLAEEGRRCVFFQGDACNIDPKWNGLDLVLACNLIDRLYDPKKFLGSVHEHMNKGGVLIILSPYTWLEEFTPKENWLGGYKSASGQFVKTIDGLHAVLDERFEFVATEMRNVPFVIRETCRKFQHSNSEMTVWRLR